MDVSPEGDPEAPEGDPEGTSPSWFKDVDSSGWLDDAIAGTAPSVREREEDVVGAVFRKLEQNQLWARRLCCCSAKYERATERKKKGSVCVGTDDSRTGR